MNRSSTSRSSPIASATARSGLTCPPVPPPTRSTRHGRALAGGSDRLSSNVQQDTDGNEADADRGASVRDERQRDPGHRHEARDDGHVHPGLEHDPHRDPGGEQRAGAVRRGDRDPRPLVRDREEQQHHRQRPPQAELVAEHREDRIGVRRGQETELLLARGQPLAERAPEREPVERLDGLEARAARVAPGIEERDDARHPVRLDHRGARPEDQREGGEGGELAQPGAGDEIHREADRAGDHERRDAADEQRERDGHRRPAHLVAALAEPEREVEDERELRELRGLDPGERRDPQPPRGAADPRADAREEDRDQQDERDRDRDGRDDAVAVIVDARDDQHRDEADAHPHRLLDEEVPGVVEGVEGPDAAGAVHHREPDREERGDHGEERQVVPRRRTGEPQLHARAPTSSRTAARKASPRSSYEENMSNEAQAGDSRTTSPGRASRLAARTASSSVAARSTGMSALAAPARTRASASSSAAWPMRTAPRPWATTARPRSVKSAPFETPPRITTAGRPNAVSAAIVANGVVPCESFT